MSGRDRLGDDGLTRRQRRVLAARWRATNGKKPTAAEADAWMDALIAQAPADPPRLLEAAAAVHQHRGQGPMQQTPPWQQAAPARAQASHDRSEWMELAAAAMSEAIEADCDGMDTLTMAEHLLGVAIPLVGPAIERHLRDLLVLQLSALRDVDRDPVRRSGLAQAIRVVGGSA